MEKAYDKTELSHFDRQLRVVVDKNYELCMYKCDEPEQGNSQPCKQSCYNSIIVPFRHATHLARDKEETNYRKCLAKSSNFPNIQQEDFVKCSHGLFVDRIDVLMAETERHLVKIMEVSRSHDNSY